MGRKRSVAFGACIGPAADLDGPPMDRRRWLGLCLVMRAASALAGTERPPSRAYERAKRERERERGAKSTERSSPEAKQPNRRESVAQRKEAERAQESKTAAERQAHAKELAARHDAARDAGRKARQDGQVSGATEVGSESKRPSETPGSHSSISGDARARGRAPG